MKKNLLLLAAGFGLTGSAIASDLHINSRDYAVDTLVMSQCVGPGTKYAYYRLPDRPLDIFVLEMDLTNPYLNIEVWNGGNAAVACETPTHAGQRYASAGVDVIAVHNGDFFSTILNETGISRMGLVGAGEMIFNPTGNPLFCLDGDGFPRIDFVNFGGTVTAGTSSTRLHTVNQLRLEWEPGTYVDQLSLYTPAFGAQTHSVSTGGTLAIVRPVAGSNVYPVNTPLTMEVVSIQNATERVPIPADGAVLHGVGASSTFLSALVPGQQVTLNLGVTMPSYPGVTTMRDAIGGSGHIILRNGEVTNINNPDIHPRTFMGISQDGKTVYSVVVDGRSGASAGIDLDDQGRVLKWLGAWDGINLDGGGSSCMVVNGVIRNHTSDGQERAVGNGVILYSTAPEDHAVSRLQFKNTDWTMPIASMSQPVVMAFNQYDYLLDDHFSDFVLTCDPEIGTIKEDGHTFITSTTPATGYLTATTPQGISTSVKVNVTQVPVTSDFDKYVIDDRADYPLLFTASTATGSYPVDAATMTWTVSDPGVATYADGKVRGVANGTTKLSAVSAHFTGDIEVVTEIAPASGTKPFFEGPLKVTQTGTSGLTVTQTGESGLDITYTGAGSSRGNYIQITSSEGKVTTYGLPDILELKINPGDAPINQIRLNYVDNHKRSSTIVLSAEALEANKEVTLTAALSDYFDVTDNSCYPIQINALRFEMGVSAKNTQFHIDIPSFVFRYATSAGVEEVDVANPANAGNGNADNLFRIDGSAAPQNPAPGLYIKGDGSKVLVK